MSSRQRRGESRTGRGVTATKRRRLIDYPRSGRRGLRRWIPSFRLVFGTAFFGALLVVGAFAAAVALTPIPEPNDIARAETTIVYWNDGKSEIGRLGESNRISVPLEAVPDTVRNAILAAEDRDYYQHGGFDPSGIVRAAWNDLRGGSRQGGSTITQQYAKNAYLSHEQSISRKLKELVLSVKLEMTESKDKILEDYLNTVYFGHGAYGIDAASRAYFKVAPAKLEPGQAAALAALVQAPSALDPDRGDQTRLRERWNYVLDGMVSAGWLTPDERARAKFPKFTKYRPTKTSMAGPNGYLLDAVQREMLDRGYTQSDLDLGGFRVVTTFDKDMQQDAVEAIDSAAPYNRDRFLRLGLASVRPGTGEVVALYGGSDYLENQYSDADQASAMAGSTFKPFALAAALEQGIELDSTWDGSSPRNIRGYRVPNQGGQSYGTITLQRATEMSVNTVYVDVAGTIGFDEVRQAAIKAGVPEQTPGLVADPTTVLGTSSPRAIDMADAYATFAARGIAAKPTMIREIRRNQGSVEYRLEPQTTRAFSENVADEVNYALQKVVSQGTGFAAQGLGRPAAGKTGTTDSNKSAWFVGYTPELSTAVMMARSDADGNSVSLSGTGGMSSVTGGSYPARIWTAFMSRALSGTPVTDFVAPEGFSSGWGESYASPSASSGSPSASATKKNKATPTPSVVTPVPATSTATAPPPTPAPTASGP